MPELQTNSGATKHNVYMDLCERKQLRPPTQASVSARPFLSIRISQNSAASECYAIYLLRHQPKVDAAWWLFIQKQPYGLDQGKGSELQAEAVQVVQAPQPEVAEAVAGLSQNAKLDETAEPNIALGTGPPTLEADLCFLAGRAESCETKFSTKQIELGAEVAEVEPHVRR